MANSLELIRAKIAELEAKLSDLRIAERELVALEPAQERRSIGPAPPKQKPKRRGKAAAPARQSMTDVIAEVLKTQGPLAATEIAEHIKAQGREIGKRSISYSLQALKKQGRVSIGGGKWMLPKAGAKRASAS